MLSVARLCSGRCDSIFGVDVNPFAVAIARFRLLLAALRTCGVTRLVNSPAFRVNLACGDSLYHGRQRQQMLGDDWTDEAHYFTAENAPALCRMLQEGTYHCVVANPPYITPKESSGQPSLPEAVSQDLSHEVFAGRTFHGTDLPAVRTGRFHGANHGQQLYEARVWQEAH